MRGKIGEQCTIFGDINYDYAKLLQSLVGYDFIVHDIACDIMYVEEMLETFFTKLGKNKMLCNLASVLIFSMIPLHNNDKCTKYYGLIKYLQSIN